ncbi:MAG: hypothetical protein ACHRXM_03825 [Isosphaerales bacterium]
MRRMVMLTVATLGVGMELANAVSAAAPATPSYQGVERRIQEIRQSWSSAGAQPQPNRPGWDAFFDSVLSDLRSYAKAESETERLESLDHLYQLSSALGNVAWQPAASVRDEIRQWLRPRVRLAWARRRLSDTVQALPATSDRQVQANRARWVDFVQDDLGAALRAYDGAATVVERQASLARIHESLSLLAERNKTRPWWPSSELETAVSDLFNRPNLDISADVNTVEPLFNANLVETGPVLRKGYLSQVTAGPKTGFGLLPSNDGIAFYNSQLYTSVTPIWDFQNQVASNPQGQRAIKLYQFNATTYDWSELTITTVLKSTGLEISPSYRHAIDAAISSAPTPGGGLGRAIAALIGMNQQRINAKVYEGSIGEFRQRIPVEAQEEGAERIAAETVKRNADLRVLGLVGDGVLAIRDLAITQLSMRSQPAGVAVGGVLQWRNAPGQAGADAPLPQKLATIEPGITAGVHLGSLLSSLAAGGYRRDEVQSVQNLMIVIREVPPGTPPRDAVKLTKNVDFATFAKAVEAARKPKPGSPKETVLRITRPRQVPEFSADARGYLVAMIHNLQLEVPAPEQEARGGLVGSAAKIYRIKVPLAEFALSYKVDSPTPDALKLHAKVEDFNPGPNVEVLAITDDETKGVSLSRFSAGIVIAAMGGKIRSQPIDVALDQIELPGFSIRSISPLDPSGWLRVGLVRNANSPLPVVSSQPAAGAHAAAIPESAVITPEAVGRR